MDVSRRAVFAGLGAGVALCSVPARAQEASCSPQAHVATGLEIMQAEGWKRLEGKRVGLVANPTSVDTSLRHLADILHAAPNVQLSAIFGPEHGFRGSAEAGFSEARTTDPRTGVTVFDIYALSGEKLETVLSSAGIDLLLFDIQDIGARFYTYIWTLYDVMQACAHLKIPVLVLDRPNPITGLQPSGPILQPAFSSFVGRAPIALRHGMTAGELARYFNAFCLGHHKAALDVVEMTGWKRDMFYDQTGLPWVAPSPNMPTLDTALAYPGTCLFEGTVLSVGRGTAQPFLVLGGPEVDGGRWVESLRAAQLPGVLFRETWFSPSASVDHGTKVHGMNLVITDRKIFDPVQTGIVMLSTARRLASAEFWRNGGKTFDQLAGTDALRKALDRDESPEQIMSSWKGKLAAFKVRREKILLY